MVKKRRRKKSPDRFSMRLTPADKRRIRKIKSKTGVLTKSDAMRIGLKKAAG